MEKEIAEIRIKLSTYCGEERAYMTLVFEDGTESAEYDTRRRYAPKWVDHFLTGAECTVPATVMIPVTKEEPGA